MTDYKIIKKPEAILKFSKIISECVDANKRAFGFLPEKSYEGNILAGKIWAAIDDSDGYVGHIMFGGKPPYNIRIFQIFVIDKFRKKKVASAMLGELQKYAESEGCFTLEAHIADDLKESIKFYESQGFFKNCDRGKRNTTGRNVIIYTKKLNTPSLLADESFSIQNSLKKSRQVGLADKYVLDLNVLFEILEKRGQYEFAKEILKAAFSGEVKISVTPEFSAELKRHQKDVDPVLEIAGAFPVLGSVDQEKLTEIEEEIRKIIFPERSRVGRNSENDASDLRHLAYCVYYGIPAFLTLENKILRAQKEMLKQYNLQICSPIDMGFDVGNFDFQEIDRVSKLIDSNGVVLVKQPSALEVKNIISKLYDLDVNISKFFSSYPLDSIIDLNIAYTNNEPIALFAVQRQRGVLSAYILIAQDNAGELLPLIDHFLETISRVSQKISPNEIRLYASNLSLLNAVCIRRGYILDKDYSGRQNSYKKLIVPLIISASNWLEFKEKIELETSIMLPIEIPSYKANEENDAYIEIKERNRYQKLSLFQLETTFSPSVFLLPERDGVIVSIKQGYAEGLISRSGTQLPFPINNESFLRLEKAYFRSPERHSNLFCAGMPIVFYESKGNRNTGRGVIGLARITSSSIVSVQQAIAQYRRNGVLSERELQKLASDKNKIHVLTFDNFKEFINPVSYNDLKAIGCAKASLVAPEKVNSPNLSSIIHRGYNLPMRDIFISIKPEYVVKIISKKKTIELRRKPLPCEESCRIWIYSTVPDKCVKATAKIAKVSKGSPAEIWKKFGTKACISKEDFDDYFYEAEDAYAIELIDVKELPKVIKLAQIQKWVPEFSAPQFFRYLEHGSNLHSRFSKYLLVA